MPAPRDDALAAGRFPVMNATILRPGPATDTSAQRAGYPLAAAKKTADGGWVAEGHMLPLTQGGYAISSRPIRPVKPLPAGARVTSLYWRIKTAHALPKGISLSICMPAKCVVLDGLAGRNEALAGMPADNPILLMLKMAGRSAIAPPVVVTSFQLQVNYRGSAH